MDFKLLGQNEQRFFIFAIYQMLYLKEEEHSKCYFKCDAFTTYIFSKNEMDITIVVGKVSYRW